MAKRTASMSESVLQQHVGSADLMFLIDAQSFAVEFKTEIGTQSNTQAEWQELFGRAGGKYFIGFGLDDVIGILLAIRAFRPDIKLQTDALGKGAREENGISSRRSPQSIRAQAEPAATSLTSEAAVPA